MTVQGDLDQDVVAYAELSAALATGARPRDALLAERGLDEDAWAAIDERWQDRLSEALAAAGDRVPPLVTAHAEAFARAQDAIAGEPMPLERFAEATAAVQRGGDVPAALARLGLEVGAYLAASRQLASRAARDPALAAALTAALARAARR